MSEFEGAAAAIARFAPSLSPHRAVPPICVSAGKAKADTCEGNQACGMAELAPISAADPPFVGSGGRRPTRGIPGKRLSTWVTFTGTRRLRKPNQNEPQQESASLRIWIVRHRGPRRQMPAAGHRLGKMRKGGRSGLRCALKMISGFHQLFQQIAKMLV